MELPRDKIKEIINDDWLLMDDCEGNKNCDVVKELARIALASLEAEAIAVRARWKDEGSGHGDWRYYNIAHRDALMADETRECELVYTATPAPVSVPLAIHDDDFEKALSVLNDTLDDCGDSERGLLLALDKAGIEVRSDACRAAMLHGSEPVTDNTNQQFESLSRGDK